MRERGFTLIELAIGAGVLVTALLGLLGVFTGLYALNESARNRTIATHHADRIIEDIRRADFATEVQVNAQAGDDSTWEAWAAARGLDLDETSLSSVTVDFDPPFEGGEPVTWSDTSDPLRLQVIVGWSERGRTQSAYLETLITDRVP